MFPLAKARTNVAIIYPGTSSETALALTRSGVVEILGAQQPRSPLLGSAGNARQE